VTRKEYDAPVMLVGAGPCTHEDYKFAARFTGPVVAVDGGYDALSVWGEVPDAIVGDMDSITSDVGDGVASFAIAEQDSTDLEKALRTIEAPLYVGVGFLDGRLDHTLAAMHALVSAPDRAVMLIGSQDIAFAAPMEWRAELPVSTRVSFFPVRPVSALRSSGLRWPVEGLAMEGGRQIGVSNETSLPSVSVTFADHGIVTILPRACLPDVIESLT